VTPPLDRTVLAWHSTLVQRAQREQTPAGRALVAVLLEHRVLRLVRHNRPVCRACWYVNDRARIVEHPCPTLITISGALGVPVPRYREVSDG
jgi:hypothetical protein